MRIIDAAALSGFARKTAQSVSDFASVVHELIMDVRDSYRPEQHYMHGPGPESDRSGGNVWTTSLSWARCICAAF